MVNEMLTSLSHRLESRHIHSHTYIHIAIARAPLNDHIYANHFKSVRARNIFVHSTINQDHRHSLVNLKELEADGVREKITHTHKPILINRRKCEY